MGRWWLRWWSTAPDELAVLVAFRQNADQTGLTVIRAADVVGCDAGIAPCCGDGDAREVGG